MDDPFGKRTTANAFLAKVQKLGYLLDSVYSHTTGEIWLFDNDLKVLEDYKGRDGAFFKLYCERIDGSLSSRVRSIKILLRQELFEKFWDREESPQLFKNLCGLRANRLRTFYVGNLDEIDPKPPRGFGGHLPWIFYLGENLFESRDGIVIVRPEEFPFFCEDLQDDLAIAWHTSDPEADVFFIRLSTGWFKEVFVKSCKQNFKSIEPEEDGDGNVTGYHQIDVRSDSEIYQIHRALVDTRPRRVIAPVNCVVITTLDEEYQAVLDILGLDDPEAGEYATGWKRTPEGQLSIVVAQCPQYGSVSSAEMTARVLTDWIPSTVFLVGRCGGWRPEGKGDSEKGEGVLIEGDVVVSSGIHCYEYQAIKRNAKYHDGGNGESEEEYDVRHISISHALLMIARNLIRKGWKYDRTQLPDDWPDGKREPEGIVGEYACGCKLVRLGNPWFEEIKKALGARKIIAAEMEGEGVGWVINRMRNRHIRFLMIKGISDFADPEKTDKFAKLASTTAAKFLSDMLEQSGFRERVIR